MCSPNTICAVGQNMLHETLIIAAVLAVFNPLLAGKDHVRYTNYDDPANYVQNDLLNPSRAAPVAQAWVPKSLLTARCAVPPLPRDVR